MRHILGDREFREFIKRGLIVLALIRHKCAAVVFLFFILGSVPPLRAKVASDFNSDWSRRQHPPQRIATTGRIISINARERTMRVSGLLPVRIDRGDQLKCTSSVKCADEYTVVTTGDAIFQDGADAIRFEDFKSGETISIHGVLKGMTLMASRLAKWN